MFACPISLLRRVTCAFRCVISLAVADAIRTSLGPRGMDKMIQAEKGEVLITNDGATILGQIQVARVGVGLGVGDSPRGSHAGRVVKSTGH